MKICVFGAGAVGGNLAALLAKGGAEVSVVARGPHLAGMRDRGILLRWKGETIHAPVRASDDPATLGRQDAVIVTLKAPSLAGAAPAIATLLGPETPVVFADGNCGVARRAAGDCPAAWGGSAGAGADCGAGKGQGG